MASNDYYRDESNSADSSSLFKTSFKYFKNSPLNSFSDGELIDPNHPDQYPNLIDRQISLQKIDIDFEKFDSLYLNRKNSYWPAFEFSDRPGLTIIPNPFLTPRGHLYWSEKCLREYAASPNLTNVDSLLLSNQNQIDRSDLKSIFESEKLLKKLRWATLGYHHNWDTKLYQESNKSIVPAELEQLSELVANLCGFEEFRAEAVIVNYYRSNSTLAGHVDRSENRLDQPLISISFGRSAVFLIGGETVQEKPTALKLNSGDVVIMNGKCRLAYHAVPRILSAEIDFLNHNDQTTQSMIGKYLNENRININVRKVN